MKPGLALILVACAWSVVQSTPLLGVIQLDSLSFNKTISRFPFALIKFDGGYPTGEKHKIFAELGVEFADVKNLLLAEVRIKDYGDKENQDIGERFAFKKDELPEIILIVRDKKGRSSETRYGGEVSSDDIKNFLKFKAGPHITLPGCLKKYDQYAQFFANSDDKDQKLMLEKVELIMDTMKPGLKKDRVMKYRKIMETFVTRGQEGVDNEEARAIKLLSEPMSKEKQRNFQHTLNVLKSFKNVNKPSRKLVRRIRDEL